MGCVLAVGISFRVLPEALQVPEPTSLLEEQDPEIWKGEIRLWVLTSIARPAPAEVSTKNLNEIFLVSVGRVDNRERFFGVLLSDTLIRWVGSLFQARTIWGLFSLTLVGVVNVLDQLRGRGLSSNSVVRWLHLQCISC